MLFSHAVKMQKLISFPSHEVSANLKTKIEPDFVRLEFNLFLEIASLVLDPSEQVLLLEFDDVIQVLGQVFQFLQRDSTVFVTRNAPIDASTNASNLTQV